MKRKNNTSLWVIGMMLFLGGCSQNSIFNSYRHLSDEGWKRYDPIVFTPQISDTLRPHRFTISVRHDSRYAFKNLWLLVSYPNERDSLVVDTVNCILANDLGIWLGRGLTTKEVQIPFEEPFSFPRSGTKHIGIEQAMTKDPLQGITEIALHINN